MSRYEANVFPAYDVLLQEVEQILHDPELAAIKLPESLHSILYIGQPRYSSEAKRGVVSENVARTRWISDVALTALWFYAVNRREEDPEHLRRKDLIEIIAQSEDPKITEQVVSEELNVLIEERLIEQIPPLMHESSADDLGEYTLSIDFDRIFFRGLKEELELRKLSQPYNPSAIPHIKLAS